MANFTISLCHSKSGKLHREKVPDVSGTTKITDLRNRATKISQLSASEINLVYCGKLLNDADKLESYSIKNGSVVHILKKKEKPPAIPPEQKTLTDDEIQKFMVAFGMALRNPAFQKVLQRLKTRDGMESLAAACPGLADDPVAMAFLIKPELLLFLLEPETLQSVAKKHPALGEAAYHICAAVHEEGSTRGGAGGSGQGAGEANSNPLPAFAYHLDEMSDEDEDMDVQQPQGDLQRNRSFPNITQDQLAAALAAAQNSVFQGMTGMAPGQEPAASGASTGPSTSSAPVTPGITHDMFREAMEQALAASRAQQGPSGGGAMPGAPPAPSEQQISQHLATMREMGIIDEGLARRALTVMGGDLQAAIDLIFSGWLGDDDAAN